MAVRLFSKVSPNPAMSRTRAFNPPASETPSTRHVASLFLVNRTSVCSHMTPASPTEGQLSLVGLGEVGGGGGGHLVTGGAVC